mgnify:CR=1 FL=1
MASPEAGLKLPPVMLPVGNRRLLEHQVEILQAKFPDERVYLSLPNGYQLSKKDALKISKYKIDLDGLLFYGLIAPWHF